MTRHGVEEKCAQPALLSKYKQQEVHHCPGASLHKFAYNDQGQVRLRAGLPIYECNSRCRCGYDCPNRVVQKGIRYDLCIFRTDDGRGWGVRTLEKIRKNSFVMEYVGEVGRQGLAGVYGSPHCVFPP